MTNFSKGPWIVSDSKGGPSCFLRTLDGHHLCSIVFFVPEEGANTRLIAAAPEMYELLKMCEERMKIAGLIGQDNLIADLIARIDGTEAHDGRHDET